jgi:hypothetical protein
MGKLLVVASEKCLVYRERDVNLLGSVMGRMLQSAQGLYTYDILRCLPFLQLSWSILERIVLWLNTEGLIA